MKRAIQPSPVSFLPSLAWAAALFFVVSGCSSAADSSVDAVVDDSAAPAKADAGTPLVTADGPESQPDATAADTAVVRADAISADALAADAEVVSPDGEGPGRDTLPPPGKDAGAEAASGRADAVAPDTAAPGDTSPRGDAKVPDTLAQQPDAEALPCVASGPATLVRLTPLELKTILASSEDPYLINVKGTSIANIPGTDAVLANDIPGIETLVGGNLCANIILYCRSGATSQSVATQLIAKGYLHVRDLEGGINAWTAAGYPTE